MPRDSRQLLTDIQNAALKIAEYVRDITLEQFKSEPMRSDAVLMNLAIIGEASKNLPEHIQQLSPETDWRRISGLRNIVIHEYFGVDLDIVWGITQKHVPGLLTSVTQILNNADPSLLDT